jgi:5-methylcytosine-specific restriction endonuclease McrA
LRSQVKTKPRFMVRHLQRLLRLGVCFWCGEDARADGELDHVVPLSRGGDHSEGNTVLACARCNNDRNSLLVIEWRRRGLRNNQPLRAGWLLRSLPRPCVSRCYACCYGVFHAQPA